MILRCILFAAVSMSSTTPFCVLLSLNFAGASMSSTMRIRVALLPTRIPVICACTVACRHSKRAVTNGIILEVPVKILFKIVFITCIPVKSAGRHGG